MVVEQVIQCVLEGAGKELSLQIDRKKARAGVDVFVTRHAIFSIRLSSSFDLDTRNGSG